jgi:hypothetical protein
MCLFVCIVVLETNIVFILWHVLQSLLSSMKAVPLLTRRHQGEEKESSYSLLASALYGMSGRWYAQYPLDRRLGGPRSWSGHTGYRKIICLWQGSNLSHPVCSQTICWLSYPSLCEGEWNLSKFYFIKWMSLPPTYIFPKSHHSKTQT